MAADVGQLLHGLGKQEEAFADHDQLGPGFLDEVGRFFDVDVIAVFGQREVDDVAGELAERAHAMVADVPAARGRVHHHHVAGLHEAAEHGLVGIGTADGPHFAAVALEEDLQVGRELVFDHVDIGGPPVVALPGVPFGVPMGKVRAGAGPGPAAHDVFAGDEIDATVSPLILLVDQPLDFGDFALHT